MLDAQNNLQSIAYNFNNIVGFSIFMQTIQIINFSSEVRCFFLFYDTVYTVRLCSIKCGKEIITCGSEQKIRKWHVRTSTYCQHSYRIRTNGVPYVTHNSYFSYYKSTDLPISWHRRRCLRKKTQSPTVLTIEVANRHFFIKYEFLSESLIFGFTNLKTLIVASM